MRSKVAIWQKYTPDKAPLDSSLTPDKRFGISIKYVYADKRASVWLVEMKRWKVGELDTPVPESVVGRSSNPT